MGQSRRQVEYLIKTGRLTARKEGARWLVRDSDLPVSPAQRQAAERKSNALHAVAEEVLGQKSPRPRYSVTDLKAFRAALDAFSDARRDLPQTHPALPLLRAVLDDLAVGCHRYEHRAKAEAYGRARDATSRAVCALLVESPAGTEALVERLEHTLLPAISGLMRRAERTRQ
jgi:hypothetical protein